MGRGGGGGGNLVEKWTGTCVESVHLQDKTTVVRWQVVVGEIVLICMLSCSICKI